MPIKAAKKIIKEVGSADIIEKTKNQVKEKTLYLQSQFKEHSSTAIIAALSFVIGLTWKDLILKVIDNILKPHLIQKYPYLSELITAVVVTIFAITTMTLVSRWAKKPEKQ
ncbi:MAG TPA: DUF5654 family protein [Candidatus Nanoarchaeia archaeon]|nr:DUF5654 family protein [Candidatus Nanoarchaeia archaeon]